jgi:hypothetical protein
LLFGWVKFPMWFSPNLERTSFIDTAKKLRSVLVRCCCFGK